MDYTSYITSAAALLAVIAAAWSTVAALIIHKRNVEIQVALREADFRQEWIDKLRDAMSEFQSYGVTPELNQRLDRKFYELGTKIELLMNPKDVKYPELKRNLYRFLNATSIGEKYTINPEYIEVCQKILKTEWEVLKSDLALAARTRKTK